MSDKLFLLGGYDLEMLEIKELLKSKNIAFKDKELKWGAKLSDYKEFLNFDGTLYGIELEQDIEPPKNYIEIDHHGKNDHKKSSLEQVAEILGVGLDDDQMLIAANDTRYISGMKALCATKEEIDEIRARDRASQGVTKEDEELALQSFNIALSDKSNVIYSKTSHFSAVSDLAFYKYDNYIIYNDSKIVFYGYKKSNILDFLSAQNVIESSYYYGGGDFGFVGIKEDILTKGEIKKLIDEFAKMKKDELYSYHTFMLPFVFKGEFKEKENWVYEPFGIKNQRDYNEYIYFYKHVQDAIYNKENKNKEDAQQWISKYYEYKEQKGTYTINCKKGIFELVLDGISLRVFNTNVAILSFNLKNTNYSELDDILAINDFGRRIYPQFLGKNFTCDTKNAFLANSISLQFENQLPITDNFTKFDTLNFTKLDEIPLLPKFITELINSNFEEPNKIRPIIDDRMFVISWYGNNNFSQSLKCEQYIANPKWYEYVFVDGNGINIHSNKMQTDLITKSTYDRWMDNPYGCTLYGISRYSFVAVTNESDFAKDVILKHMQTMYFQMFTLLLAYRATIIKFADDIQNATTDDKKIFEESQKVYKNYLTFLNKLFFKEATAQDQGIELYSQAMKIMDIEKYISDLDHEINELYSYVGMLEEEQRNDQLYFISKIGAVLLPPTLVAGLFGMNILTFEGGFWNESFGLLLVVLSGFIGFVFADQDEMKSQENSKEASFWDKFKNKLSKFKKYLVSIFICLVVLFAFFIDRKKEDSQEVKITNEPTVILKENRDTK